MEHNEEGEDPPLAVQIQGYDDDDDESISQQSSVGVTLITGYLGAGKSTVSFHFSAPFQTPVFFLHLIHSQVSIFSNFWPIG